MTVPIQIKRDDVVRDIRELAALRRKPITQAVGELVRAELERERERPDLEARNRAIDEAIRMFREAPVVGPMLTDDDLYDENGFPL